MKTQKMIDSYNKIASEYAVVHREMSQRLVDAAKQFIEMGGGSGLVLDVGCGTGRDMAWFEAQGVTIIGIDVSSGMLNQARKKVVGSLLEMDMQELAFSDGLFSGIWCNASLLHLPKETAPKAIDELRRVLNGNGVLFLSVQAGTGEGWEASEVGSVMRWMSRYSEKEISDLLFRQGFTVQSIATSASDSRPIQWLNAFALPK